MPKKSPASSIPAHFPKEALTFLRGLSRANNRDPVEARDWFAANKETYESKLKAPMLAIVQRITDSMIDYAPDHVRPAEKCLFRIYRDTRFSNDKRPYKDHIAAWWGNTGFGKTSGAGFYFHVSAKEITIGVGAYMPEKEQLAAIRYWLVDHHDEFRKLLNKPALRKLFGQFEGHELARTPKGFPTELDGQPHPAQDLIRCRQWGLHATLPPEDSLEPDFAGKIIHRFKLAAPLVAALNAPIQASLAQEVKPRSTVLFGLQNGQKLDKTQ